MRPGLLLAGLTLVALTAPCRADDPAPGVAVRTEQGSTIVLSPDALAHLPDTQVAVSFVTGHGRMQASFQGPLLWAVLDRAHAIDAGNPRGQVRRFVTVTGRDGYAAVLALGEIAPAFEGKSVILAERMDGRPLGSDHPRLVVPGDLRGGRSVRDVVQIAVTVATP